MLEGRLRLPGIHDVHMHPLEAGSPIGGGCYLDPLTPWVSPSDLDVIQVPILEDLYDAGDDSLKVSKH